MSAPHLLIPWNKLKGWRKTLLQFRKQEQEPPPTSKATFYDHTITSEVTISSRGLYRGTIGLCCLQSAMCYFCTLSGRSHLHSLIFTASFAMVVIDPFQFQVRVVKHPCIQIAILELSVTPEKKSAKMNYPLSSKLVDIVQHWQNWKPVSAAPGSLTPWVSTGTQLWKSLQCIQKPHCQ